MLDYRVAIYLSLALHLQACNPDSAPIAASAPIPNAVSYPEGIRKVLGLSTELEFFDDSVSAATARERMASDGFHYMRFDLLWEEVEPAPGVWEWSKYDREVELLLDLGFEPIVLLLYGNAAYFEGSCAQLDQVIFPCLPEDKTPFYVYVKKTVERYRAQGVRIFEIWNEPNGWYRFWPTAEGGDPHELARFTSAAAKAIREVCEDCTVLSGAPIHLPSPINIGQLEYMSYMQEAVPDIFRQVDGMGFHFYTFYPPVDPPETSSDMGLRQVPLDRALRSVREACDCETPLWITETGWTAVGSLTETDRARYAVRGYLIALSEGVQSWLWWSARDVVREHLVAGPEGRFGLFSPAGEPHPPYLALSRTANLLGDAIEVQDVRRLQGLREPYEWAMRFMFTDGRRAEVFWDGHPQGGRPFAAHAGKRGVNLISGEETEANFLGPDPVLVWLP
jgi:polysaccharide biosynthesis protein PslG